MKQIAIIGGGASGFAAAITIAKQRKDFAVTVYERLEKPLKKILATGNGRCNLTNMTASPADYFGDTAFASAALAQFPPKSTLQFFSSLGLLCKEEDLGRVYPMSGQASSVREVLLYEAERLGVQIKSDCEITTVRPKKGGFLLNESLYCDVLVFAFGGKAAPKQGTDGSAFSLMQSLSIPVISPQPALTALVCKNFPKTLKGVRNVCDISLSIEGKNAYRITGEVQFTDYGLSGVPIMQLSRLVSTAEGKKCMIVLDCLPQLHENTLADFLYRHQKTQGNMEVGLLLSGLLPKNLATELLTQAHIKKSASLSSLSAAQCKNLLYIIKHFKAEVASVRGFDFAQVTAGGADCRAFCKSTLECKTIPHLYACGEALNVDGGCGGYNLQWAWSSGRIVGEAIIKGE